MFSTFMYGSGRCPNCVPGTCPVIRHALVVWHWDYQMPSQFRIITRFGFEGTSGVLQCSLLREWLPSQLDQVALGFA